VGLEDPPIRSPAKASKQSPLTEMSLSKMEESTNVSDPVVSCLVFPENVISSVLEIDQRLMNKYFTLRDAFRAFD
jgi:hypothetical protein